MTIQLSLVWLVGLLVVVTCKQADAETADNGLSVKITATSKVTDNAHKAAEQELTERQDSLSGLLSASYSNRWLSASLDYIAEARYFEKQSQDEREILDGDLHVDIGGKDQWFGVRLSQSNRRQLENLELVELTDNFDERSITSIAPFVKFRISPVDQITVQASQTLVDFRYTDDRDSDRNSGRLEYKRNISKTSMFVGYVDATQVEFKEANEQDYDQRLAGFYYGAKLRQFQYKIDLGYQELEDVAGESYTSPRALIEVQYIAGRNQFDFSVLQELTDTSIGNGNETLISDILTAGGDGFGLDKLKRRLLDVAWTTNSLCERCTATTRVRWRDDNYRELDDDNTEFNPGVSISYQISRLSDVSLGWQRRYQRFQNTDKDDYFRDNIRLSLSRKIAGELRLLVFAEYEARRNDAKAPGYTQQALGLALEYTIK